MSMRYNETLAQFCFHLAKPFAHLKQNLKTISPPQLVNNGPSLVSQSTLEVKCPLRAQGYQLLYPVEVVTEGLLSCDSKHTFNALKLKVRMY